MPSHPYRRLHVNPALREAISADGRPGSLLAFLSGLPHSRFSSLINAASVPDRPKNVLRLERIANTISFPVAQVFVTEPRTVVTFGTMPSPPVEAR